MRTILFSIIIFTSFAAFAQEDKSQRPSPPALAKETLNNGTTVSIDYSQPAVKGRTIGTDLEPLPGKVWRTGANEATVFEVDKDIKVENNSLAAGKYGLFTLVDGKEWTIIFNKTWSQWGAFNYKEADDVLRVKVRAGETKNFSERMTFTISKEGVVTLLWGDIAVSFKIA
jgi:hypothetical protein